MPRPIIHGDSMRGRRAPEYQAWADIIKRCENPNVKCWTDYGGRGITICTRWRNSYVEFLADVGRRPSPDHEIDRIDNNGNYEPGNVRWTTRDVQLANRRDRTRKTHCKRGHAFTPENTTIDKRNGGFCCRTCMRDRFAAWETAHRAERSRRALARYHQRRKYA